MISVQAGGNLQRFQLQWRDRTSIRGGSAADLLSTIHRVSHKFTRLQLGSALFAMETAPKSAKSAKRASPWPARANFRTREANKVGNASSDFSTHLKLFASLSLCYLLLVLFLLIGSVL